jgi:Cu(I)/Ag(I) efflux system membrane protein CusA/SilA
MKSVSSLEGPQGIIEKITDASGRNPFLIGLLCLIAACAGFYALSTVSLDAVPDLSDVQVIVYTNWEGRNPSLIEDQITYPITSRFLGAPRVKAVRGLSMFGRSFVYVIFDDGTDIYWARSRVLEYLNSARESLPPGVTPTLGPDATGVGWVYEYALVDDTGQNNLAQLRSLQDWMLKYALGSVKGVAEVASIGGFVKQYQVNVDPNKLINHGVSLSDVIEAVRKSNSDVGGKSLEISTTQYFIRGRGYIHSLDDLRRIPLKATDGTPLTVDQVATVELGPDLREGLAEFNGQGEAVGGIIVMRFGENALSVINGVKQKIDQLKDSLPPGVRIVPVYDRSQLILRSIDTLREKLIEESIIVSLVCIVFLWHLRSALVAIIMLPMAVLLSFIPFAGLHLTANIMSLGGIAIAIGAMVDAAIIMIENAHKELEHARAAKNSDLTNHERVEAILHAARKMGRPLFFSLLVITVSFVPVFTLEGQAGRLFQPLAFTKTFAMFFAALLSVTLVPVLMVTLIRGRITPEARNPINRILIALYRPVVDWVLRARWLVVILSLVLLGLTAIPILHLGSEFMPPLNEGDLLFMPTSPDGLGTQEAARILHEQNVRLKQIPEFMTVFGKAGAAETATDPAPMSMFETTIQVKPPDQWRPGMTWEGLQREIQDRIQTPGMADIIWMPIQTRTEMLTTGFRSNLGLRVYGRSLHDIADAGEQIEQALKDFPDTRSVFSERSEGGRYLDIVPDRDAIARYNLSVDDINQVVEMAIGGNTIGYTVEGRERYPISVRLQRDFRDSVSAIQQIPVSIPGGGQVPLSSLASIEYSSGPPEVRSENGQLVTYVSVDTTASDFGGYAQKAGERLRQMVHAPPGVYWEWAGSFEQLQQVESRLLLIIPFTLLIIILLIYVNTRSFVKTCIVLLAVPFSLIGAFWLLYFCGYQFSVAVAVGLIALAGIDAETGVVMLIYLDHAFDERVARGAMNNFNDLIAAVKEGAVQRIRPKMMTMSAILFGLLPIMWSTGSGSEVMKRIAAPMIGGVVTSAILGLLLYPVLYVLWRRREIPDNDDLPAAPSSMTGPKQKALSSRKFLVSSTAVVLLLIGAGATYFWLTSNGGQLNLTSGEQGVVIASRTVNGLEVKVTNAEGELHNDDNKVALEFHDQQTGDLVDVGKVAFALNMSMPGMQMHSPATIETTSTPGRYLATVTPDMVGDWNGVILYDGPRGQGEVHLNFSVKN